MCPKRKGLPLQDTRGRGRARIRTRTASSALTMPALLSAPNRNCSFDGCTHERDAAVTPILQMRSPAPRLDAGRGQSPSGLFAAGSRGSYSATYQVALQRDGSGSSGGSGP